MGRKIRTPVPQTDELLVPKWPYLPDFRERHAVYKGHQKKNFDSHHGVRPLPDIPDDSEVWINSGSKPVRGTVLTQADAPRSYVVSTPSGIVRRNRQHLNVDHSTPATQQEATPTGSAYNPPADDPPADPPASKVVATPRRIVTRSQTGTAIHPPVWP